MAAEEGSTPFRREALERHARGGAAEPVRLAHPRWVRWLPLPLGVALAGLGLFATRVPVARVVSVPGVVEALSQGLPMDPSVDLRPEGGAPTRLFFSVPARHQGALRPGLRVRSRTAQGPRDYEVEWVDTEPRRPETFSRGLGSLASGVLVRAHEVSSAGGDAPGTPGTVEVQVGTESLLAALWAQARGGRR
ncbi:hypothetical protein COCOR_03660 [Corallococcus coralloides DSM 2259]|uniref:Uncharacterized protein n=1 Tax=Corallococcus coralloides (strain ATCC 25202 / DSM 2259 / NBRC 100086 / M2) TaxID=1144275 RepID=H8MNE6_CORCM|nr:hypothetical protein [Corallococcus coralloides]AFE05365.1 hypothetical protein COCOR_03660 [Corallococcus coralloides DSM 2259]